MLPTTYTPPADYVTAAVTPLSDLQFSLLGISRDHAVGLHHGASLLLLQVRFSLPAEARAAAEQCVAELKATADDARRQLSAAAAVRRAAARQQQAAEQADFAAAYARQQAATAHLQAA